MTIFNHVGWFLDLEIFRGPLNKVRIFVCYLYIQIEPGTLGGAILLALCARIIIYPVIITWKCYL